MGASQSSTVSNSDPPPTSSFPSAEEVRNDLINEDGETSEIEKKAKRKNKNKDSIDYKCRKQKRGWSRCISNHYEKQFLPGKSLEPEEDCDDLFDSFRDCYMRGMLKQRQAKGLAPPKKDSMLHEYMVDEGIVEEGDE
mmetsp:Transcript_7256/g.14898  ORF Transcript_7256/g.14898 Transcript_7256/m.14898 type:complete len:138 (-) Transcript_7256:306-719(-)|eukprot:CAMPEP_0201135524 /NCGR_PEP_ID=MMETSP0850-20130426/54361_1 /ASSEMBLY_ACC=CAM_ASM_000622 /TAXON_ID=183588 /ORGANISM="Pseudo-nitzschia fraudulenta, Strain WWA7" /LENGTH=137 /DNA_ID=CAMNT_0047406695 /DNA_START=792 /DNA_END=1205 /DNA_ORIENTATION=-